jgi:hypothetical protein
MNPLAIEPATFWLVTQWLNHPRYSVPHQYNQGDQMKKNEMGGTCGMH